MGAGTGEWSALVTTALLGAERAPAPLALPAGLAELAPAAGSPEQRLLAQATALSPWMRAGQEPARGVAAEPPCDDDGRRPAHSIGRILAPEYDPLVAEWCAVAARAQRTVAPHLLPEFLDRMAREKDRDTLEAMRRVLGKRGEWLARFNPPWRAAAMPDGADANAAWQSGTRAERIALLQRVRAVEPAAATALIASTQEADPPDDVAACVAELATGLSMADHDFLEALLDARHKPVRSAAARLLARLTASARAARMSQRVSRRLAYSAGASGFLRKKKGSIEAKIPDKEEAAEVKGLARDGIDAARKRGNLGPKANLLLQLVAATPLAWFQSAWNADPADMIDAALEGEWSEALLLGWAEAAIAQQDAGWARALLEVFAGRAGGVAAGLEGEGLGGLMRILEPASRERFLIAVLEERPRALHDGWVQQVLDAATHSWSDDFSQRFLDLARRDYLFDTQWSLRAALVRLAAHLSPRRAEGIRDGWPVDAAQWTQGDTAMVDRVAAILELRRDYLRELST
jgi:hypothetical protein